MSAADLAGYNVYRATWSDGPWTKLTGSTISARSYDATNLTNGSTYFFAVTSVDTTGNESAKSTAASATPAAADDTRPPPVPRDLDTTPGDTSVHLAWAAVSAADLEGYNVYRATSSGGPWTKLTGSPISANSYEATELTNGTTYHFAVTSVDNAGNESAKSASATGLPTATRPGVSEHCGQLGGDQTWSQDGGVHRLTCDVVVPAGATLTISAKTIIKADANTRLYIQGSLVAVGAENAPVVFTTTLDDSVGVDLSGNSPEAPTPSSWGGIHVADSASATLERVEVRYADRLYVNGGSFQLVDSLASTRAGLDVTVGSADLRVSGSAVSAVNRGTAIAVSRGYTGTDVGDVVVSNNELVGGLYYYSANETSAATADLRNNQVSGAARPFQFWDKKLRPTSWTGSSFTDATYPAFYVAGELVEDWRISAEGPTYTVGITTSGSGGDGLSVPSGRSLKLDQGVVLKFHRAYNNYANLHIQGSLVAVGAENAPVVFTTTLDDSVGVDLSGNSPEAPTPSSWGGIHVADSASATLERVEVRYADRLYVNGGSFQLVDSLASTRAGLDVTVGSADLRVSGSAVSAVNRGTAIAVSRGYTGTDVGDVVVSNNELVGGLYYYSANETSAATADLRNNQVSGAARPFQFWDKKLRPTSWTGSSFTDATYPAFYVAANWLRTGESRRKGLRTPWALRPPGAGVTVFPCRLAGL
ncbi:fibronectin type III domain-containing protein [Nocardioides daphniae]|uniref:fibronectin type III domain-containing protein n=1 Tax=Nocardioides daphniae TaxID=402297 RepID=UPI001EE91427|nr:fibronectin type III domain-containing protein [Nocardioides daphniae]